MYLGNTSMAFFPPPSTLVSLAPSSEPRHSRAEHLPHNLPAISRTELLLLLLTRSPSPGKYLRQKRIDFQLPYDILWLWKHDQVIRLTECSSPFKPREV